MTNTDPEVISKYKISGVLGKGSMGVVYEGFDPDIERKVAIKTLTPNIAEPAMVQEFHQRFKIEAQASARCMHPNIVTILEYGDQEGMPYIVMEFINGSPLDEIFKQNAPIKFNRALKVFSQILKGLHFAHQSGVVHRDIKPSNVMVTASDSVKITDFGIARLPVSSEVTQMGYTVGTPHYMAPEQEASSNVDGRADLFSLTVIFLEMLARVPFSSKMESRTLSPKGIYITPRVDMNQQIPLPFALVAEKGLAFRPEERFANAQQYASALKQAVADVKGQTAGADAEPQPSETAIQKAAVRDMREHLDEMDKMLTHYIGPIASSLIDHYVEEAASLFELAEILSTNIAASADRKKFLSAWEADREITEMPKVPTSKVETSLHPVSGAPTVLDQPIASHFALSPEQRRELEDIFSGYVGPMAEFLLQEILEQAEDFDDLLESLLESIPTDEEKTDFKLKVSRLAV